MRWHAEVSVACSYYYRVGDGETFGDTMEFHSLKAAGSSYPQRLLLIADWGLSHNSRLISSLRSHRALYATTIVELVCILHAIHAICHSEVYSLQ